MEVWYQALGKVVSALLTAETSPSGVTDAQLLKLYNKAVKLSKQTPQLPKHLYPLPCHDTCVCLWPGARSNHDVRALIRAMRENGGDWSTHVIDLLALRPPGEVASYDTICSVVAQPCNHAGRKHPAEEWLTESVSVVKYALSILRGRVMDTWLTSLRSDVAEAAQLVPLLERMPTFASIVQSFYTLTPDDGVLEPQAVAAVAKSDTVAAVVLDTLKPLLQALPPTWQTPTKQMEAESRVLAYWLTKLK